MGHEKASENKKERKKEKDARYQMPDAESKWPKQNEREKEKQKSKSTLISRVLSSCESVARSSALRFVAGIEALPGL